MQISITGKQIDIGDALRDHISDALDDMVGKYFGNAIDATVVVSRDGQLYRADVGVHVGRGIQVRSHEAADDVYAAFDVAAAHLAKRLRRNKRRLRDHHQGERADSAVLAAQQYVIASPTPDSDDDDAASDGSNADPVIIAEQPTTIETLSVSEAVMRMDLADAPALMFRDARSGALNVVYRRHDNNIGWINPVGE